MKCYFCGANLIWQSDFSNEDYGYEEEGIVSNYICGNAECRAEYEIFKPENPNW